jgi:DNA-binding response OmpR family regulator
MDKETTKNILIVEDERELALGLATLLKSRGYSTNMAFDGLFAISQALEKNRI